MFCLRNQYGWSSPCKNKLLNGEEIVYWLDIVFAKGQAPSKDKIYLRPTKFFMTCYMLKGGETKPKMFIQEWQEDLNTPQQSNGNGENQNTQQKQSDPFANKTIHQNQAPKTYQPILNGDNTSVTGSIEDANQDYIDIKSNDLPFY